MTIYCGIDIVELSTFEHFLSEHSGRAEEVLFTPGEWETPVRAGHARLRYLAARFAAKEATMKALGGGAPAQHEWRDIEIRGDRALTVCLHGNLKVFAASRGIIRLLGSCASTRSVSIACIYGESSHEQP